LKNTFGDQIKPENFIKLDIQDREYTVENLEMYIEEINRNKNGKLPNIKKAVRK